MVGNLRQITIERIKDEIEKYKDGKQNEDSTINKIKWNIDALKVIEETT